MHGKWRILLTLCWANSRLQGKGRCCLFWRKLILVTQGSSCRFHPVKVHFSSPCPPEPRQVGWGARRRLKTLTAERLPSHPGPSLAMKSFSSQVLIPSSYYSVIFHLHPAYLTPHKAEGRLLAGARVSSFAYLYGHSLSSCWGSRKLTGTGWAVTSLPSSCYLRPSADKSPSCSAIGAQAFCSWCRQHIPQCLPAWLLLIMSLVINTCCSFNPCYLSCSCAGLNEICMEMSTSLVLLQLPAAPPEGLVSVGLYNIRVSRCRSAVWQMFSETTAVKGLKGCSKHADCHKQTFHIILWRRGLMHQVDINGVYWGGLSCHTPLVKPIWKHHLQWVMWGFFSLAKEGGCWSQANSD